MNSFEQQFRCRALAEQAADARFAYPGTQAHYAPDRLFDTRHIRLDLSIDFSRKTLGGVCRVTLEAVADPAAEMVFDAVDFKMKKVSAGGQPITHAYDGRKLRIHFKRPLRRGQRVDVAIAYEVRAPKLGLHFIGPSKAYPDQPLQAWTQGEDEYNRFWFPCHDAPQEKATTEMIIACPAAMTAISNGKLLRSSRRGNRRVFHYRESVPHSPYLVSLVVGEFSLIEEKWRGIPVQYYVPKGREEDGRRAFGKTPDMLEFFSSRLGVRYPYEKYAQTAALDFIYGGMENTSATTQTALTLHDARAHQDFSSDPLVAHELAHQWFGDLVTCKDWSHAWLNESFATYFEALYKEHDLGYDEFMYELHGNAEIYLQEDKERYRRPMVTTVFKNPSDLFDRHLYEKGSLILHMLRMRLGDATFWRAMNLYLKRHQRGSVETLDLIRAIEEASGWNPRPFFDQWIFKGGHPVFKLRTWWDARARKTFLRVIQMQKADAETPLYQLDVEIDLYQDARASRKTIEIRQKDQLFSWDTPRPAAMVVFDPRHTVLKSVDFPQSEAMASFQLQHDPHVLGRVEAAQHLGAFGTVSAARTLSLALLSEKFWGVQVEIAQALGRMNLPPARDGLLEALRQVDHPKVRRGILSALASYPTERVQQVLAAAARRDVSWLTEAQAIRSLARMRHPAVFDTLTAQLARDSWNDVIRGAAVEAIAFLRVPESLAVIRRYAQAGHFQNTRMVAIQGLTALAKAHPDIQDDLIALLKDPYLRVQMEAVRALGKIGDERAAEALRPYAKGDRDGRLKRGAEDAIRQIRKGMNEEMLTDQDAKAIRAEAAARRQTTQPFVAERRSR